MNRIIADLHVHSGYSRATSKEMNVKTMALWGRKKGINIFGTGDFTHPAHFRNLKQDLIPLGNGLFTTADEPSVHFMLTAEISSIYKQGGKVRKTHNLIYAPSFEVVKKINNVLDERGNISSDGRPILGIPSKELIKMVLDISDECLFVPAHVWTPWFSIFGSKSGFDSIEECFEDYAKYIYAIETGLSSDPEMNWRISALDNISLLSNSDAHSPAKLGREANVLSCEMSYHDVIDTIKKKDRERFLYTVEFFPEEGKYHFDGHRVCGISFSPAETKEHKGICPVCNKPLVVGVTNRVDELADRPEGFVPENAIPSKHLVPLVEIIAGAVGQGVNTKKVKIEYDRLLETHTEFEILLDLSESEIDDIADERVAEGIKRVRSGKIKVVPGYDGEYGKVSIF
jgi:uncharacterized protein (TIGR00375 family)